MNDLILALIVAVVQGITEWIPVSSSGHLVLTEYFLGYNPGLAFDVALHFGTLMAVFVYFGKDITDIIQDVLKGDWGTKNARLGFLVLVATIPAVIFGFLLKEVFESVFYSLSVVAMGFAVTSMFLFIASLDFPRRKFGVWRALGVGFAQIFALFPGISRSGSTVAASLVLGLKEKEALKFSFLMSIPVIFGANVLTLGSGSLPKELIWASLVSFVVGLGAIHVLYKYALNDRRNLRWFALYALLLSLSLFLYLFFR